MMSASSSDEEVVGGQHDQPRRQLRARGSSPHTPARRQLGRRDSSPIHERRAIRKKRRVALNSGLAILEKPNYDGEARLQCSNTDEAGDGEAPSKSRSRIAAEQPVQTPSAAFEEALAHLPTGFAEDFFLGTGHGKLKRSLTANAVLSAPLSTT